MPPPNTSRTKSRQQAGSLAHRHRLPLTADELLIARVWCYRQHLVTNPDGWYGSEVDNFRTTVQDADLTQHQYGISLPGEPDPGLTQWDTPLLSPNLDRLGTLYSHAALWGLRDQPIHGSIHFTGHPGWGEPHLSAIIASTSPYTRAWWIGAIRDGDTKDDSIRRAEESAYCRPIPQLAAL